MIYVYSRVSYLTYVLLQISCRVPLRDEMKLSYLELMMVVRLCCMLLSADNGIRLITDSSALVKLTPIDDQKN